MLRKYDSQERAKESEQWITSQQSETKDNERKNDANLPPPQYR
jgi:hypothetical protein